MAVLAGRSPEATTTAVAQLGWAAVETDWKNLINRDDVQIVKDMSDTLDDYRDLQARVLLLGGTESPAFLDVALDGLQRTLPRVERVICPNLGHDGPEDDGKPDLVAQHLRRFFG